MTDESINLESYFPYFLGTVSNRWTATSSQLYLKRFGIGIGEWRVLASVRALGPTSSQQVLSLTSMDAGAISRSMKKLEQGGFVRPLEGKFAGRTKPYEMTQAGKRLYDDISTIAREREEILLQDLTHQEREGLFQALRKILHRIEEL